MWIFIGLVGALAPYAGFTVPKWLVYVTTAPLVLLGGGLFAGLQGLLIGVIWCALVFGALYLISLFAVLAFTAAPQGPAGYSTSDHGIQSSPRRRLAIFTAIAICLGIVLLVVLGPFFLV
jgi:hypothetical protein